MKLATGIGILLILLGVAGLAVGEFTYSHEKKFVDFGSVQIQRRETRTFPISPLLSTLAMVGGAALVIVGAKSK